MPLCRRVRLATTTSSSLPPPPCWNGPYTSTLLALPFPRLARLPMSLLPRSSALKLEDHVIDPHSGVGALAADFDRIEQTRATAFARMRRGANEWAWRLTVCGERQ